MFYQVILFTLAVTSVSAQNIEYFNYLDYSSKWEYFQDWNGIGGESGTNEEIYYIDGDTLIEGEYYYHVFKDRKSTSYPSGNVVISNHRVYSLREDNDSVFTYIFPNGEVEQVVQTSSLGAQPCGDLTHFVNGQLPFRVYYSQPEYGPQAGYMEGIGRVSLESCTFDPLNFNTNFICYERGELSTTLYGQECIINEISTSVTEVRTSSAISIHPNPASTRISIKTEGKNEMFLVRLIDAKGLIVSEMRHQDGAQMSIDHLVPGLYCVVVQTSTDIQSKLLVVQR